MVRNLRPNHNIMRILRLVLPVLLLAITVSCSKSKKTLDSTKFYSEYKNEFLNSDLPKFNYDPQRNFTPRDSDLENFYSVSVLPDSSLKIIGTKTFSETFKVRIGSFLNSEVILSKHTDSTYFIKSTSDAEPTTHIILKEKSEGNIVDYFLNLQRLVHKFGILEIKSHPFVNVQTIVFSGKDYLRYKPNSLVFRDAGDTELIKNLFAKGKQLDSNWYQFSL